MKTIDGGPKGDDETPSPPAPRHRARGAKSEAGTGGFDPTRVVWIALVTAAGTVGACLIPQSDVALYGLYAHAMLHGPLSRGLPVEYPALAGALFVLVALAPGAYFGCFVACMAAAFVALAVWGDRKLRGSGWLERVLLYVSLGCLAIMFARFDIVSAACCLVAVVSARNGRYGRAWVAAFLGAALQFFPALLLPGFFLYEWRQSGRPPWRRACAAGMAALTWGVAQQLLAPGTLWHPVLYEMQRGFEFSSVPGSITLILSPAHLQWRHAFGAWQVLGAGAGVISPILAVGEVLGALGIWMALYRRRLGVEAASLAVISVAVLCDRALAPQYLLWLAPLWALWPLRRAWVASAALTFLTFPVSLMVHGGGAEDLLIPTVVGLARNCALLVGTISWLRAELRSPDNACPMEGQSLDKWDAREVLTLGFAPAGNYRGTGSYPDREGAEVDRSSGGESKRLLRRIWQRPLRRIGSPAGGPLGTLARAGRSPRTQRPKADRERATSNGL